MEYFTEVERIAALKLIDKRAAVLRVPFLNKVWLALIEAELAYIRQRGPAYYDGAHRIVAHVAITTAGRRALEGAK